MKTRGRISALLISAACAATLLTACGSPQANSSQPTSSAPVQSSTPTGLVAREDGFFSFYNEDGTMVTHDYVQTEDQKLYFFNSNGIGAEICYTYLADNIIQVFDNMVDSAFIVVGEEQAAVIDGMNGTMDMAQIASFFTDKPLIALATHGHGDHVGGLQSFDTVYVNANDFQLYSDHSDSSLRFGNLSYDNYKMETGSQLDYTLLNLEEDILTKNDSVNLQAIEDGQIFDLGGTSIECIATPGHTPGSMSMLLGEAGILITGDSANRYTQITGASVESYLATLEKLKARESDYTRIFASHGILKEDGTNTAELSSTVIDELIEGCQGIMDGSNPGVEVAPNIPNRWAFEMGQFGRIDGKCGNFMFNSEMIFD